VCSPRNAGSSQRVKPSSNFRPSLHRTVRRLPALSRCVKQNSKLSRHGNNCSSLQATTDACAQAQSHLRKLESFPSGPMTWLAHSTNNYADEEVCAGPHRGSTTGMLQGWHNDRDRSWRYLELSRHAQRGRRGDRPGPPPNQPIQRRQVVYRPASDADRHQSTQVTPHGNHIYAT
jgi:hypothetical protein